MKILGALFALLAGLIFQGTAYAQSGNSTPAPLNETPAGLCLGNQGGYGLLPVWLTPT
jgi:hypothetical protein